MSARISALPKAFMQAWKPSELIPKRIEVKPVVRRATGVMLQSLGIALRPMLNVFGPAFTIQNDFVGEMLEVNFVAVPAVIDAEKQNHRTMHHCSKQNRAGRKSGRRAEELALSCFVAACDAVA